MLKAGLVGLGIDYSKSKEYFNRFHPDIDYTILDTEYLALAIGDFLRNGYIGFNVTTPYKRYIKKYLDDCLGDYINCVKITKRGKLIGISTVGMAIEKILSRYKIITNHEKCLESVAILGNGGVVPAILDVIKKYTKDITIYARQAKDVLPYTLYHQVNLDWFDPYAHELIINCIPFSANVKLDILRSQSLCAGRIFHFSYFDLNYAGDQLSLELAKSNKNCINAINGLEMLYEQAELSYKFWL